MTKKKFTLEDLKLESFLTEMDDTKLMKLQGGGGIIQPTNTSLVETGNCPTCDCPTASDESAQCADDSIATCDTSMFTEFTEYYTCGNLCQD